jgi:hypothetical protein
MPLKLENLCRQVQNLKKSQHQQREVPDFELDPCSGPLWDVLAFLDSRKLGPTGRSLYDALTGFKPLTEAQEELLQKVLAKLQHPEWLEPILQELDSTIKALTACDAECALKPTGWKSPGLM